MIRLHWDAFQALSLVVLRANGRQIPHTAGPWAYDPSGRGIVATDVPAYEVNPGDDPAPPLAVIATRGAMGGEDTAADIALICAAPELLAACEVTLEALEGWHLERLAAFEIGVLRAAIAKARA